MNKILQLIDGLILKIPLHLRDIIHKASLAVAGLLALLALAYGISRGLRDAKPGGVQLIERNDDLFYLDRLREENKKKMQLLEDVEVNPLDFPSHQNSGADFKPMGRDTSNRLMGEKDSLLEAPDILRSGKERGFLDEEFPRAQKMLPGESKDLQQEETEMLPLPGSKERGGLLPPAGPVSAPGKSSPKGDGNLPFLE